MSSKFFSLCSICMVLLGFAADLYARRLSLRHRAFLLSALAISVAIGAGGSTEIDQPSSEKQSGYTLDNNKPYFKVLFLVKFLAATPMLHLKICCSFSDTKYVHGHVVDILILTNCYVIMKLFL